MPYIIAEVGVNHGGDIQLARRQIREAAAGGASAVKFQTYKAEKIACKASPAYWDTLKEPTTSQFTLFKKYDSFGPDEYRTLAAECLACGVEFLSTPFDLDAVEFLAPLVTCFKIASADITNIPLLRRCASKGQPLVLSTGASTLPEIENAVQTLRQAGAQQIALLHCVLNYPTPDEHSQLSQIAVLQRTFPECVVGYSDHTVPSDTMMALEIAVMLRCKIIEKHFTHDKSLPGNDHYHAMDQRDLRKFCERVKRMESMYGTSTKEIDRESAARRHARRSVVASRHIQAGEVLNADNLTTKRPAHGISPIHWDALIGKRASVDIEDDTPLAWQMVSES